MTQLVASLTSVAVVEDADITKDEIDWTQIDWTQLLIITVVEGLVAAGVVYWLSLFLMETDVGGGPAPSIMFLQ
jgi:hypothetical protein